MARRKAGTCIHAICVGKFGSVFVKKTCPNLKKIYIKAKDVNVIIPIQCERCESYIAKPKQKNKRGEKHGPVS